MKYLLLLLLCSLELCAQDSLLLSIQPQEWEERFPQQKRALTDIYNLARSIHGELMEQGYASSSARLKVDTANHTAVLQIERGPQLQFELLELDLMAPDSAQYPEMAIEQRYFESAEALLAYRKSWVENLENNGYPFAQSQLELVKSKGDTLQARLILLPGPLIQIDSIALKGYDGISKGVMKHQLGLAVGMLYSEREVQQLPLRANQIEFLRFSSSPALAFSEKKTTLYLYIEEEKSNEVDGIIGLNTTEDGQTTLNGNVRLRLLNRFKRAEEIRLQWQRPDESVQQLDALLRFPYLFNSPLGIYGQLEIFRQDSSFVNSAYGGGLQYRLGFSGNLQAGVHQRNSNSLNTGDVALGSFKTTEYELGLEYNALNRSIIPTAGYRIQSTGFTARRTVENSSSQQYGWQVDLAYYLPLAGRHILLQQMRSRTRFGEALFLNELFRLGGLKSLRGFNEQQFFSNAYGVYTLEYRYMIGAFDYLTIFQDFAYSEQNTRSQFTANWLWGIGAGTSIRNQAGIFSLFYALGRDRSNPFDFRLGKIHFGYISRF